MSLYTVIYLLLTVFSVAASYVLGEPNFKFRRRKAPHLSDERGERRPGKPSRS